MPQTFDSRTDAGRQLAAALAPWAGKDPVVLALPRGGVPVAAEVARALHAPLDVVLVRKLGAPGHPELGIGAIVDGPEPQVVLNDSVMRQLRPSEAHVAAERERELAVIDRRRTLYRERAPPVPLRGRSVIVVDDGIATGGTMRAALRALAKEGVARRILAVPVAPAEVLADLEGETEEIVCLSTPEPFRAVGFHYRDFGQTPDEEVIALLRAAREDG
ncbi:phosphoribosyltransferase [Celeribacter indicus]|uniref:Phosphoribosyltransferase n=1 Tax=Celeribacter indicus TaxID=1208324 RepID=A0A0B5E241_9RHOB|nr:phosphoribosyltransferase [Celeribacter indicus]AJE47116.1 phosphoribosyltransferase [Celeribacter indicus]SDW90448.1 Predicted phosphoribosyltransferase [Celeribacter indicus]